MFLFRRSPKPQRPEGCTCGMSLLKCDVHDPEGSPKPVAPPGYHFQVTDDPQLCCSVAMDDDMDEDCELVVRLVETATGNVITEEGVYNRDRPAFWIEFAMSQCLTHFNNKREEMQQRAALKQYVGFYPPKEI